MHKHHLTESIKTEEMNNDNTMISVRHELENEFFTVIKHQVPHLKL